MIQTIDEVVTQITYTEWNKKEDILREYVEQIIELCAQKAVVTTETMFDNNERPWSTIVVDTQSILKVKELIK